MERGPLLSQPGKQSNHGSGALPRRCDLSGADTSGVLAEIRGRFSEATDRPAIIWRDQPFTYGWLRDEIARCDDELGRAGVGQGHVVTIEGDHSPFAVALLYALLERGAIAVPLTMASESRRASLREIAEAQFVGELGDGNWSLRRVDREITNPLTSLLIAEKHAGLVLFTSGSTGASKGALHDFVRFAEKYQRRRPTFVTLAFLLLDHLGGIDTIFSMLSNLGTLVVIESRNPDVVCSTIAKHRVGLLPTTPTFLNLMLASRAHERHDLSSLVRITYGTEPMPETTLLRVSEALPHVALQQTYGLSEMGVLRSKSRGATSLWLKLGGDGYETKIEDGTLRIRARSAMQGYLNHPSPFDADGWYDTADLAVRDGEWIRFLGRRSEAINVGGEKCQPIEVENVVLQMTNVKEAVAFGEAHVLTGQVVVVRVVLREPEDPAAFRSRLRRFCRAHLRPSLVPAKIEIADVSAVGERMKIMRGHPKTGA